MAVSPKSLANLKPRKKGDPPTPRQSRGNTGGNLLQQMNALREKTRHGLIVIARDARQPAIRVAAAVELLKMCEYGDMADYEPAVLGKKTLEMLRKSGVRTDMVKKFSVKPGEFGDARSIELFDRGGEAVSRVLDRTVGRPNPAVVVQQNTYTAVKIISPLREDLGNE